MINEGIINEYRNFENEKKIPFVVEIWKQNEILCCGENIAELIKYQPVVASF